MNKIVEKYAVAGETNLLKILKMQHKLRAILRALVRSLRHCIRLLTTPAPWKYKFTRRSWSVTLQK